jgi:hypothetical protein
MEFVSADKQDEYSKLGFIPVQAADLKIGLLSLGDHTGDGSIMENV